MNKGSREYALATREASKADPDLALAADLLKQSIAKGNPNAMYALATWYLFGVHVKRSFKMAATLLKQCADEVAEASYDLAVCYELGRGVKKSLPVALEYYMRSALQGDAQAHFEVGRCFFFGIGTSKNVAAGKLWMKKAESLGYIDTRDRRTKAPNRKRK